jgi:hypothetical protein
MRGFDVGHALACHGERSSPCRPREPEAGCGPPRNKPAVAVAGVSSASCPMARRSEAREMGELRSPDKLKHVPRTRTARVQNAREQFRSQMSTDEHRFVEFVFIGVHRRSSAANSVFRQSQGAACIS